MRQLVIHTGTNHGAAAAGTARAQTARMTSPSPSIRRDPRGRGLVSLLPAVALLAAACMGHSRFDDPDCAYPDQAVAACPTRPAVDSREGRTELRVLVLTSDLASPSLSAARSALDRLGVSYDVLEVATQPLTAARLATPSAACAYRGVILDVSGLPVVENGDFASGLSDAEWQILSDFEVRCAAREVVWYAYPGPELGLEPRAERDGVEPVDAVLTRAGELAFPYLQPLAHISFQGGYAYLAAVKDPVTTTALVQTARGEVLVAVHRRADGSEVLAMTVDSSDISIHAKLLEHGVLSWLMRGLFVGQRRAYMSPQIDDLFIPNFIWVPGAGQGTDSLRITAADMDGLARWQGELAARLPAGSRFVTTLALNAAGTTGRYEGTDLEPAALAHAADFFWLNHTWDHLNMDMLSYGDAQAEIERNLDYAARHALPGFDPTAAVTPEVSGLDNFAAVAGMLSAGVRVVVSDSSITAALRPKNPGTNSAHNVGRANPLDSCLYQVPRHPTEIYVNCATAEEEVDRYNLVNGDDVGRDLTYAELLDREAQWALRLLLDGDIDPLMFHQSNLHTWNGTHSLYSDWVDAALSRFTAAVNLPVLSLPLGDIGRAMRARNALDRCGAVATLVTRGAATSLEIRVEGACAVPVTGLDAPAAGVVEVYGGVPTTSVALEACQTTSIPVTGP